MPGQRFGYPVGSHYTGPRGVRDYLRHIRSTHHYSTAWRGSATAYAARLGRFALRGAGLVGAAATAAELGYHGYHALKRMYSERSHNRRKRPFRGGYQVPDNFYPEQPSKMPRHNGSAGSNPSVMTMSRVKSGRYKPFNKKMMSLMKASLVPYIDRWGVLTTTYDATGTWNLVNRTTDTNVTFEYPVFLYELNTAATSNTAAVGSPMMQLKRTTATGNYSFVPVIGSNADATANVYAPYVEYNGDVSVANSNAPYGYLDWCDIRMTVTGPKKTSSKFKVQLIRFTDQSFQPPCYTTLSATPTTLPTVKNGRDQPTAGDDLNEWNNFWQKFVAHLLGNPLNTRSEPVGRKFTVLKTFGCTFQPRSTTDDSITGGTGDTKLVKWFNRVGKTFTYAQADTQTTSVTTAEEINPTEAVTTITTNNDTHARPLARMFLLITGYTPVVADGTTDRALTDVGCSFDLLVRRKFYFTDHN